MALRASKALRNFMLESGSLKQAFQHCRIKLYSGAQPATADAAPTGTLLVTYTNAGGANTAEVLAAGTVTLTAGSAGSVDTVTVNALDILGGAVPFNTSLSQTATDVAAKINNNPQNLLYTASASGAVVTLKSKPGLGALPNGWVVAGTLTTMTASYANMAGGVSAVNGLTWGDAADGKLTKSATETWQGTAVATGTAGWFRVEAAVADAGAVDSAEAVMRLDGSVATSGGDMNMASTSIVMGAVQTLSSGALTLPTL